jgi:hypothetical protein
LPAKLILFLKVAKPARPWVWLIFVPQVALFSSEAFRDSQPLVLGAVEKLFVPRHLDRLQLGFV